VASGDALLVAEDSDISPYETVGDVSPAVEGVPSMMIVFSLCVSWVVVWSPMLV
jgi:hypothetical protein